MPENKLIPLNEIRREKLYTVEMANEVKYCIVSFIGKGVLRTYNGEMYDLKDYGKSWRLWQYEPTKQERISKPWET